VRGFIWKATKKMGSKIEREASKNETSEISHDEENGSTKKQSIREKESKKNRIQIQGESIGYLTV
jgi:hypothetical protein